MTHSEYNEFDLHTFGKHVYAKEIGNLGGTNNWNKNSQRTDQKI